MAVSGRYDGVTDAQETCRRNLMHVTKIVRSDWSAVTRAVFENFWYRLSETRTELSCVLFGTSLWGYITKTQSIN